MKTIRTKKNMLFILLALLTISVSTDAQQLSEQQALQNANEFLAKRGRPNMISAQKGVRKAKARNSQEAAYYVFNVGNDEGFVIASGDERTEKILGYSDSGTFDEENMPDNLRAWLQGYADQISNIPENHVASETATEMDYPTIEPLLKTKWGQRAPYNAKCPEKHGSRCATGCVPTALAQLLNYHQYPNTLPALDAYSDNAALPEYDIDWNSLKNEYTSSESDDNLSWLMRYCGQAVHVDYGTEGSSTFFGSVNSTGTGIENALIEDFGYNKYIKSVYRGNYSVKGWNDLLISELKAKRPVYLSGTGTTQVGHAFICDGYNGNGLYHINWGWDGLYDGYFCIEILNPTTQNVTDEKNSGIYSNGLNAAIGVSPLETMIYPDLIVNCYPGQHYGPYGYWISIDFVGPNSDLFPEGKMAVGVFDEKGNLVERQLEHNVLNGGGSISSPIHELGIDDGHYYLKALFKPSATEDWHDIGFDWNVIELIKKGTTLTVIDNSHRANEVLDLSIATKVIGECKTNTKQSIEVVVTNNGEEIAGKLCCDIMGKPNNPIKSYGGPSYDVVIGAGETMTFLFDDINKECNNFQEKGRYNYRLRWEELQSRYSNTGCLNKVLCYDSFLVTDASGQLPPVCSTPVVQSSNGMIMGTSQIENAEFAYMFNHRRGAQSLSRFSGNAPSLCYQEEKIEIFMYAKAENYIPSDFICDSVIWKNAAFVVDSIVSRETKNANLSKCSLPHLSVRDNLLITECETEGANYVISYFPEKSEIVIPNHTPAPFVINIPMKATAYATGYENSDIVCGHLILSDLSFVKEEYPEIIDNYMDIEPIKVKSGQTISLPINLNNQDDYIGFQCDITLPDELSYYKTLSGNVSVVTDKTRLVDDEEEGITWSISKKLINEKTLRIVASNNANAKIVGNVGAIFYVKVDLPEGLDGDYNIKVTNINMSDGGDFDVTLPDVDAAITIFSYTLGDINDDGRWTITDVTKTIEFVLDDGYTPAADMNSDGKVTITDVTKVIECVLDGGLPEPSGKAVARKSEEMIY